MTATSPTEMETIVDNLHNEVAVLTKLLRACGHCHPSFSRDTPSVVLPENAPQEAHLARAKIMEHAMQLFQLASGPSEYLANLQVGYHSIACLQWLCNFQIFTLVPLDSSISYATLATASGCSPARLKSVIRMAITQGLFAEASPDKVSHSATSALIRTNSDMQDWAVFMCNVSAPTAAAMVEAHEKWPNTVEKTETAYNIAFHHDMPFFQHLKQTPERHEQFSGYMRSVTSSQGTHMKHLVNGYDWNSLGAVQIIDVGGSTGHGSIALAEAYPKLQFLVQDLPEVVANGQQYVTSYADGSLAKRIQFQAHSFFEEQPIIAAKVYLLRMILHDWSFDDAVKILSRLVEAMDSNSRIIVMDTVLPDPGSIPVTQERLLRVRDLTMAQVFNSHERDMEAWNSVFTAVEGGKLKVKSTVQPVGSVMSLLELVKVN